MASKHSIIDHLTGAVDGVTKKLAAAATEAVFDHIAESLAAGERVQIPGFGSFDVRSRAARQGRNPQTGATIQIAASKGVGFKAGKGLKDAVNG